MISISIGGLGRCSLPAPAKASNGKDAHIRQRLEVLRVSALHVPTAEALGAGGEANARRLRRPSSMKPDGGRCVVDSGDYVEGGERSKEKNHHSVACPSPLSERHSNARQDAFSGMRELVDKEGTPRSGRVHGSWKSRSVQAERALETKAISRPTDSYLDPSRCRHEPRLAASNAGSPINFI